MKDIYLEDKIPCQFLASYKYIRPYLENKRVLDLGCGTGEYLETLTKDSVGVEISIPSIQICLSKNLKIVQADLNNKLPFLNNSFEAVLCSHVLEHVESPINLLKECNRILKKCGLLIVCLPTEYSIVRILRDNYFKEHKSHLYGFSISNIRKLYEYTGFETKKVIIDINWVEKFSLWWLLYLVQKIPIIFTIWWSNAFWVIGKR